MRFEKWPTGVTWSPLVAYLGAKPSSCRVMNISAGGRVAAGAVIMNAGNRAATRNHPASTPLHNLEMKSVRKKNLKKILSKQANKTHANVFAMGIPGLSHSVRKRITQATSSRHAFALPVRPSVCPPASYVRPDAVVAINIKPVPKDVPRLVLHHPRSSFSPPIPPHVVANHISRPLFPILLNTTREPDPSHDPLSCFPLSTSSSSSSSSSTKYFLMLE